MPLEADLTPLVETWSVAEAFVARPGKRVLQYFSKTCDGIILVYGSAVLKFRAGTSSKANLARAIDTWGPGMITNNEGYEVTEESPVLVSDQYEYQLASASFGRGQDVRSITQEVVTEMLDAPTLSRILKLAVAKYKGQLQVNASGAGSVTMQEVAARLGLGIERARTVPCSLELQESMSTPPPYTWHHDEAHAEEVRKGQEWLQDVVCTESLKAIAVTSQTWLRAIWTEEEVEITNSKVDYVFANASATGKLPKLPAQPSKAQLLELLKHIKGLYEAKPSKHVQEKGILSLWSQMFAEFLAVTWMLDHEAGVKKSLPVFGGDFKHHMIMHQASNHVLHFMKHDPDDAGKQSAVACMWHLLRQDNVLPLETGDDVDMDVDPMHMAWLGSSDAGIDTRGGHASSSTDEHSGTMNVSRQGKSEHCGFNLQQMGAVFHEVVMRRLRSPVGYESLGKNKPPLQVEHSSFSDYVKSLRGRRTSLLQAACT